MKKTNLVIKIKFRLRDHPPNQNDFKNIEKNIKTYFESTDD